MSYPTPRDMMTASVYAAIARYEEARNNGEPRRTAEPILVDRILKAADRYALTEEQLRELALELAGAL